MGAAVNAEGATCFAVKADWPWTGTLHFDIPRHREHLGIPTDCPRLNQFPEWFTVAEDGAYEVNGNTVPAATLRQGLPVAVAPGETFRVKIRANP